MSAARKRKVHGGRWQVQRERCRIADPVPPDPDCNPDGVASALNAILQKVGQERAPLGTKLERNWKALVGASVAAHTRPGRLTSDGALIIFVDSSVWLSELSRMKTRMLSRLQEQLKTESLKTLILRIDPA